MVYTTIDCISISQTLPRFQIWVPTLMVPDLNCTTNGVMHDKWVGRDHANAKCAVHKQTHKSCSLIYLVLHGEQNDAYRCLLF